MNESRSVEIERIHKKYNCHSFLDMENDKDEFTADINKLIAQAKAEGYEEGLKAAIKTVEEGYKHVGE